MEATVGSVRDHMGRPGTPYDNTHDPSPFSEEVLGALEDMDAARAEMRRASAVLKGAFDKMMLFHLPPGTVVEQHRYPFGAGLRVYSGSACGSTQFRIESAPFVEVRESIPKFSRWSCNASPLNKDGVPMKRQCRIEGRVFPKEDAFATVAPPSENDPIMVAIDEYERAAWAANPESAQNSIKGEAP